MFLKLFSPWNQLDSSPLVLPRFSILSPLLAALEQLSDHARDANPPSTQSLMLFLKSPPPPHPLANSNSLAEVVLQLLGDKEERDVASPDPKDFKGHSFPKSSAPGQAFDYWGDQFRRPASGPLFRKFIWSRWTSHATVLPARNLY